MIKIRHGVILLAEVLALLFIVFATAAGALAGDKWLSYVPILGNAIVLLTGTPAIPVVGAVIGFFAATMVTAIFFVLVDIAHNTRNPFNS
jgi:hypothetical protein